MTTSALIIGWFLLGQAVAADGRYDFSAQVPPNSVPGYGNQPPAAESPASKPPGGTTREITPLGGQTPQRQDRAPFSSPSSPPPNTLPAIDNDAAPIATPAAAASGTRGYEVTPAQSLGSSPPSTNLTPSQMMRAMLAAQPGSQLAGDSLTLREALSGARTRPEQTQRAEAYWDLCSSVADYYLGLREQEELRRYIQRGGQWDRFELEMGKRTGTALRAAVASQLRLASLMGRSNSFLPLPADVPHCASYHTQYQQIFPNGGPQEAKELHELLPLRYAELKGAAALVADSEQYLNTFASSRSNDVDGGLKALHLLGLQRRAFVQIARDYNRRIARYSELASPAPLSAERLTGMLIRSSVSTATKSGASSPQPNRQTNRTAPPPTYADDATPSRRDQAIIPASGSESASDASSPRREHSLLVKPSE